MLLNNDEMGRLVLEVVVRAACAATPSRMIKRTLLEAQIQAAFDNGAKWEVKGEKGKASYKISCHGLSIFGQASGYFPFDWKSRKIGAWVQTPSLFTPSITQAARNNGCVSARGLNTSGAMASQTVSAARSAIDRNGCR